MPALFGSVIRYEPESRAINRGFISEVVGHQEVDFLAIWEGGLFLLTSEAFASEEQLAFLLFCWHLEPRPKLCHHRTLRSINSFQNHWSLTNSSYFGTLDLI